jgi:hypothetical protein
LDIAVSWKAAFVPTIVITGFIPVTHFSAGSVFERAERWVPGTSPGRTELGDVVNCLKVQEVYRPWQNPSSFSVADVTDRAT